MTIVLPRLLRAATLAAALGGLTPAPSWAAPEWPVQLAQADPGADIDEGEGEAVPLATVDFGGVTGSVATTSVRAANSGSPYGNPAGR